MAGETALNWESYLDYLRQQAGEPALQAAQIGEADSAISPSERETGNDCNQIIYYTLSDTPPWTAADLERYQALAVGGVWESLREDDKGE
jgi:hypothetical protein